MAAHLNVVTKLMNQFIVFFELVVIKLISFPLHKMVEAGFRKIFTTSANSYQNILYHI